MAAERDDQVGTGTVVLYPDDPALWGDGSPHVRAVRPSQAGEFEVKGLLPGAYYGIAVERRFARLVAAGRFADGQLRWQARLRREGNGWGTALKAPLHFSFLPPPKDGAGAPAL